MVAMILAASVEGGGGDTVEGLAKDDKLHLVQQAFIDRGMHSNAASARPVK